MSHTLRNTAAATLAGTLLLFTVALAPAVSADTATAPGQQRSTTADAAERRVAGDHDGDADSDAATAYTEDTDTNDGGTPNNVADDGDNAHPSGRDRSVEQGAGGTQGRSESDPDDDGRGPDRSNGGPDKPNGSGGEDLADQDGNNGCGNDDDFEDDNEGWCGRQRERGVAPVTADSAEQHASAAAEAEAAETEAAAAAEATEVLGAEAEATEVLGAEADATAPAAAAVEDTPLAAAGVLGAEVARAATAETAAAEAAEVEGQLPLTGLTITTLVVAAALALIVGATLVRAGRDRVRATR